MAQIFKLNNQTQLDSINKANGTVDKLENVFVKVDSSKQVKLGGGEAQVLFKMNPQKKFRSQEKICDDILRNDFITDGGMKEREKKYYNSTTFNKAPSGKKSQSQNANMDTKSGNNRMLTNGTIQRSDSNVKITEESPTVKNSVRVLFSKTKKSESSEKIEKSEGRQSTKKNLNISNYSNNKSSQETRRLNKEKQRAVSDGIRQKNLKPNSCKQDEIGWEMNESDKKINNYFSKESNNDTKKSVSSNLKDRMNESIQSNQIPKASVSEIENLNKSLKDNEKHINNNISRDSEFEEDRPKRNNFFEKKSKQVQISKPDSPSSISKQSQLNKKQLLVKKEKLQNFIRSNNFKSKSKQSAESFDREVQVLSLEEKMEKMEKLVKNKEEEIIREVQKEVIKKGKLANDKIQKKLKYLSERNMLDNINLEEEGNENLESSNKISDNEEENNIIKGTMKNSKVSSLLSMQTYKHNPMNRSRSSNAVSGERKVLKPKIDSLEFLSYIFKERQVNITSNISIIDTQNNMDMTDKQKSQKDEINSFRKSNSAERSRAHSNASNHNETENPNDYPFAQKTNKRNQKEIHEFIIRKRNEVKDEAKRIEYEKEEINLKRCQELMKVYDGQYKGMLTRKSQSQSGSRNNSSATPKTKNKRANSHKVKNEMFVGISGKSIRGLDESSIIDPNDYYLSALESKMILSPSGSINDIQTKLNSLKSPKIDSLQREDQINLRDKEVKVVLKEKSNLFTSMKTENKNKASNNINVNQSGRDPNKDLNNLLNGHSVTSPVEKDFASASKLSNFTKNSKKYYIGGEPDESEEDKANLKSQTKDEFLKFIEQKEKEATVRSLDSNDLLNFKSNRENYNNTAGFNNLTNHIDSNDGALSNMSGGFDKITKLEEVQLKITEGKVRNNSMETGLKISEKKEKPYDSKITLEKLNEFSNLIKSAGKKLGFYEILNFTQIQMLLQHYDMSFKYLEELGDVIVSRNVVRAFNILKENAIIGNHYDVFNIFSIAAKRQAFYQLKNFSEVVAIYEQEQVEEYEKYLNYISLFAKRNAFNAIREYARNQEFNEYAEDEEKLIELYITGFNMIVNPWKRQAFYTLATYAFSRENQFYNNESKNYYEEVNSNSVILHQDKSVSNSKIWYNNEEEENTPNHSHVKNSASEDLREIKQKSHTIESKGRNSLNQSNHNNSIKTPSNNYDNKDNMTNESIDNSKRSEIYLNKNQNSSHNKSIKSNKTIERYEGVNDSQTEIRNDNNYMDDNSNLKMHTYIYESISSESSIAVYPNSMDSPRLHRLHYLIQKQKMERSSRDISDNRVSQGKSQNISQISYKEENPEMSHTRNKSKTNKSESLHIRAGSHSNNMSLNGENMLIDENHIINSVSKNESNSPKNLNISENLKESALIKDESSEVHPKNKVLSNVNNDHLVNNNDEEIEEAINVSNADQTKIKPHMTDPDISADRDNMSDIDWIHTISNSKSSGSFRDIPHNFVNPAKNSSNFVLEGESVSKSVGSLNMNLLLKEIKEKDPNEEKSDRTNKSNLNMEEQSKSINKSNNNSQYDNYNDFEENVDVDENDNNEKDILEIIGEDKNEKLSYPTETNILTSNSTNANNFIEEAQTGTIINNNKVKSRNLNEKKNKEIEISDRCIVDTNFSVDNIDSAVKKTEQDDHPDKTNSLSNSNALNQNIKGVTIQDNKVGVKINDMIHSNRDSERENILDENNINKITIDSNNENNFFKSVSKDKESIESNEDGAFFTKNTNDIKVYNLLDDKSSNNRTLFSGSNTLEIINNENQKEKTISVNQSINRRYENFEDFSDRKQTPLDRSEDIKSISLFEEKLKQLNLEVLADELTAMILQDLLNSQIKETILIPKKSFKLERELPIPVNLNNSGNSFSSGNTKNNLMNDSLFSATSTNSNLNNSIFMKSVVDYKKETTLNLYQDKIAPKLIEDIVLSIDNNYANILNNLNVPYSHNSPELIQSIIFRDQIAIKKNYKILPEEIENECLNYVNKSKILKDFEKLNKNIREEDNITSDNYYDNILNECLIDAANETIKKERIYGEIGQPFPWGNRTRSVTYKYNKSDVSKNSFKKKIQNELSNAIGYKMGLIAENHEYLDSEQLNAEREKRLMTNIIKELTESEELWRIFELEEAGVKIELSEMVLEQLLNEVVEILEHVGLSRRRPNLYQYKSIYACEDIPRLSFQQYNTENDFDNINQ